jgi:hypothetical protein
MHEGTVEAAIGYVARTPFKQRYYANDHTRDTVVHDPHAMAISNGRLRETSLDNEGFMLVQHASEVSDFENSAEVAALHPAEIAELLRGLTGADEVRVTAPGIIRYSEAGGQAGSRDNSHPARFAHIDSTAETSAGFAMAASGDRALRRSASYNVWRCFSPAPQDVPLALCDAGSVKPEDLLVADAIFDAPDRAEWSFESWIVAHNPAHRWYWYPDLSRNEAIVFKSSDSQFANPIPHVAFDHPALNSGGHPRKSIEMRALALWFA